MKPTTLISSNKRLARSDSCPRQDQARSPLTAYSYQSTAETCDYSKGVAKEMPEIHSFRQASNGYFDAEASREYVIELIFFGLISGTALWPTIMMIRQLTSSSM